MLISLLLMDGFQCVTHQIACIRRELSDAHVKYDLSLRSRKKLQQILISSRFPCVTHQNVCLTECYAGMAKLVLICDGAFRNT